MGVLVYIFVPPQNADINRLPYILPNIANRYFKKNNERKETEKKLTCFWTQLHLSNFKVNIYGLKALGILRTIYD